MSNSNIQKARAEKKGFPYFLRKAMKSLKKHTARWAFIIPSLLIEVFVLITMSASLGVTDTVLLSLATVATIFSLTVNIFRSSSHILLRWIPTFISLIAVTADVLIMSGTSQESKAVDLAVTSAVCVLLVYVIIIAVTGTDRRGLFSPKGAAAVSAASILAVLAVYAAHGEHFLVQDPFLVLLCHVCAALTAVLTYFKPKAHIAVKIITSFAVPFSSFLLLEFLTHNPFLDISLKVFLLNTALFILFAWLLIFVFGRSTPALFITVLLPLILGLVSYFTVEFRGTPLFPWDLASYGIAATVLGGYDLTIPPTVALVCSCTVLVCTCAAVFGLRISFPKSKLVRPVAAVLLICVLIGGGSYLQTDRAIDDFDLYPYLFVPHHLYKTNGFTVSFLMNLRYTTVEKPDGYSEESVWNTAENFVSDSVTNAEQTPNVIVIMNESFADMKALCDFETNEAYLPFISSLEENTLKGDLHVSIVGGNTPNSEFEFLTGMTMGYLPSGSIPYQQFIKGERPSFATQLDSLGYHTVAMHPYWAEGWKREIVYPLLGFEEMHFLDYDTYGSFNDYPRIRDYISDEGVYDKIRLTYEENGNGDPLFILAVTMQNHSGYSQYYENFHPEVEVTGLENDFEVSTYMSLVRESDAAFAGLIEYFENADEPTVILMFGDHQPNDSVADPLMKQAGMVYDDGDIESSERRYTVPYVLWANYELDLTAPEDVSINYLSTLVTKAAGLPMTGAQKFADELMTAFPVITGRCIMNGEENISPVSDHTLYERLVNYSHLQYCYLFDSGNMPENFWTLKE